MPNLSLSSQQLEDIVAFIISLRNKAVAPAQLRQPGFHR
jgi:hypothetical protein